jgi:hypothetical protein
MNQEPLYSMAHYGLTKMLILTLKEFSPGIITLHMDGNLCYPALRTELDPRKVVRRMCGEMKRFGLLVPARVFRHETGTRLVQIWAETEKCSR